MEKIRIFAASDNGIIIFLADSKHQQNLVILEKSLEAHNKTANVIRTIAGWYQQG